MNLLRTFVFTTNHGDEIEIKTWFREQAILEFAEEYQIIGTCTYIPTVWVKLKEKSPLVNSELEMSK